MAQSSNLKSNGSERLSGRQSSSFPRSLHLLIVEDVIEDVELIVITLEAAGIDLTYDQVDTAQACMEALQCHDYHAVLSDYRLPQLNGLKVLELLKASDQDIPFILVTGSLGEEAAVECIKSGITDYVLKDRLFRLPSVLDRALVEYNLRYQREYAIAQTRQQAWRESIINRIVQAMRGTLVLDEVLQTTVDQLHMAMDIDRVLIFQANQTVEECVISQSTVDGDSIKQTKSLLYSFFQEPLTQGKPVILDKIPQDVPLETRQAAQTLNLKSIIIFPLIYQQQFWGGIGLHSCHRERHWSDGEISLIQAIADQCAIAIHQIRLYEQAQQELTERKRMEAQLRHDAFYDSLTDLPNRALFCDRLSHALKLFHRRKERSSSSQSYQFAVLFLDLDRFKVINDSLGHMAGDQLLVQLAQRLEKCTRSGDTVARLGGDEFVFLVEDITHINEAIEIAKRIQQQLQQPFILDNPYPEDVLLSSAEPSTEKSVPSDKRSTALSRHEVFINVSIGITLGQKEYRQPDQILRDADLAMYRAKQNGRDRYEIFNASMHSEVFQQLQLENDLRRAINSREFEVLYQPIFSLQTQKLEGLEALLRWRHPQRGLISPLDFIPIAEETGLIKSIDLWVLKQACHQIKYWHKTYSNCSHLSLSVNFSAQQFPQPDLLEQIDKILREMNLPGECLKIEITESALIKNAQLARTVLNELRSRNIQVCLDDFGTGYSSLGYLHEFSIDIIKIDQSFVQQLQTNSTISKITKAIIDLGKNLGLKVIAEGIETESQHMLLRHQGCQSGQGFWLSNVLNRDAVEKLLANC